MKYSPELECVAFVGSELIAGGALADVVHEIKRHHDNNPNDMILVFSGADSSVIEVDLRGDMAAVFERFFERNANVHDVAAPKKPGRPKLGVVSKEVTLLPRHWEWLGEQNGGASATLRKLVGAEMRATDDSRQGRKQQSITYGLMTAVAGDLPNFEEASRALFAGDGEQFFAQTEGWPDGLKTHLRRIAKDVFTKPTGE